MVTMADKQGRIQDFPAGGGGLETVVTLVHLWCTHTLEVHLDDLGGGRELGGGMLPPENSRFRKFWGHQETF